MKFNITNISKEEGGSLEIEASEKIAMLDSQTYVFTGPVRIKGTLTNVGGDINAVIDVYGTYSTQCGRCLAEVGGVVEFQFHETFRFIDKGTQEFDDEQSYPIQGEWLDIDKAVADAVIVELPMVRLCSEDCRGLCMNCGANLNDGECFCDHEEINPAMEKLKNFFNDN